MRRAMFEAEVGDDVYAEDPDHQPAGEARGGDLRSRGGAVRAQRHHGQPDRDQAAHASRAGGHLRGARPRLQLRDGDDGALLRRGAAHGVRPKTAFSPGSTSKSKLKGKSYHAARTGLVSLENTHNMAGGTVTPPAVFDEVCDKSHDAGTAGASRRRARLQRRRRAGRSSRQADGARPTR